MLVTSPERIARAIDNGNEPSLAAHQSRRIRESGHARHSTLTLI